MNLENTMEKWSSRDRMVAGLLIYYRLVTGMEQLNVEEAGQCCSTG